MILPSKIDEPSDDDSMNGNFKKEFLRRVTPVNYARVYMTLSELLDSDFFHEYVKSGHYISLVSVFLIVLPMELSHRYTFIDNNCIRFNA